MNMKENNKYRYTDTSERNIRMNRFYIIATSLLAIVFLFYLWLKLANHNIAPIVTYANTILIAACNSAENFIYLYITKSKIFCIFSKLRFDRFFHIFNFFL